MARNKRLPASSVRASGAAKDLKIFSGEKRLFASYGPSTTMGYPARLQRKFYRYTGKSGADCPLQISNYSIRRWAVANARLDQLQAIPERSQQVGSLSQ